VRVGRSASICAPDRESERLWILWTVWTIALETRKNPKKRADVRGCGSRVRRLWQGKGLRLPFLCVQVIGCPAREVEPHPSEPFE
jgi:hypothetical protein